MKIDGCTIPQFRQGATIAIEDVRLQSALKGATGTFKDKRVTALADLPQVDAMRDHFKQMRSATLGNLGHYLETFERSAQEAGAVVHWARDGADAREIITGIARDKGITLVTKSKSMATEEIHLNQALEAMDVQTVETDLGEWILQLNDEPPYHIIGPAIHKTREQVAHLFERETGIKLSPDDIPGMTELAREQLRQKFLASGMGISGANIGVAESGSVVLVTNEGNGRMVTSLPKIHVAVMGIEKLVPTWDDAAVWLSLLARSATGQAMSIYTTALSGPARDGDPDGPEEVHIVLLDNGRSKLVGTTYEEVLQCIRCGACLNACPVYREAGGHAYQSPYSGPIGAVLTPLLFGLEKYKALPHASSLCGACHDVCPSRIDLPRMLLELRAEEAEQGMMPWLDSMSEKAVAFAMGSPTLWRMGAGFARVAQKPFQQGNNVILPQMINVSGERKLPSLAQKSFRAMWAAGDLEE